MDARIFRLLFILGLIYNTVHNAGRGR